MASIGKLAVILTANSASLEAGFKKAARAARHTVADIKNAVTGLPGILGAIGGGVSIAGIVALVKKQMDAIDATAKLSDRLGVTTEAIVGLGHAAGLAGVSTEQLTGGLEKMLKSLAEIANNGGDGAKILDAIGLSAKTLAAESPEQAFKDIAEAVSKIEDPIKRAQVATALFGKSGQELLPLLMSGAQGIAAAQAEAEKLGITFSRVDAAKVEQANDAMEKIGEVVEGLGNKIAIVLSPVIQDVSDRLVEWATVGEGVGSKVTQAFGWIVGAIGKLADYLELGVAGFKYLQAAAAGSWGLTLKILDAVAEKIVALINLIPGVNVKLPEVFTKLGDDLLDEASKLAGEGAEAFGKFSSGENSKAVKDYFDSVTQKATESAEATAKATKSIATGAIDTTEKKLTEVEKMLNDLDKQIRQFGLSDIDKKLDDLATAGATPEQLKAAQAKLEKLEALTKAQEKWNKMQEDAKSVIESIKSPQEKLAEQLDKLQELYDSGLLSAEQFSKAVLKAQQDAAGGPAAAPGLIEAGSQAGQKRLADIASNKAAGSATKGPEVALQLQKTATDRLGKIVENTAKSPIQFNVLSL